MEHKIKSLSIKTIPMNYEDWYAENEEMINMELAESGADREHCFNSENEFEKRYNKYLENDDMAELVDAPKLGFRR